jgi:nucleoside-diphosphate-sugar epimerase
VTTALIGHTGFVGGNIARTWTPDEVFNSRTIEGFRGRRFTTVVCAGAYAEKWRINQDPAPDDAGIRRLAEIVCSARIDRLVLISTVDVFPSPRAVDESTPIDPAAGQPYGRHRHWLETTLSSSIDTIVVRLPALYGPGLKKNAIFDLVNENQVDRLNGASSFQFYDVRGLWADIQTAMTAGLRLVHPVTEPVQLGVLARDVFEMTLRDEPKTAANYDVRTRHADVFDRAGPYLRSRAEVISSLRDYVASGAASRGS